MKYDVDSSSKSFRKSVRLAAKRGCDMSKLEVTITLLSEGAVMPEHYRDHPLKGSYHSYRECHIGGEGDWLLIYKKQDDLLLLTLIATGTHSDLFDS